jgi:enhancer of mRNA-decapping protein 3
MLCAIGFIHFFIPCYLLDDGLVIPSIMPDTRHQLLLVAERLGLTEERQAELMGRAATEMALQLLGGGHR